MQNNSCLLRCPDGYSAEADTVVGVSFAIAVCEQQGTVYISGQCPLLCWSSNVSLSVYRAYFPDWQGLPLLPGEYLNIAWLAVFSQRNTRNKCNKLPVAIFSAREMRVICTKYNSNNHNS